MSIAHETPITREKGDHVPVGQSQSNSRDVFTVRDLRVYYGDLRAVDDVNLDVREHEIL